MLTSAEAKVKDALYQLWFEYYTDDTLSTDQRIKLVEDFTEKWLDPMKIKVDKPAYFHPMNHRNRRYDEPKRTVTEILADFIMRADMHKERREEYPVTHEEQELTNTDRRRKYEVKLFSDELDEVKGERVPFGYITEAETVSRLAYKSKKQPGVEEVRRELAKVKEFAEYWATTLSNEYGYDKAEALERINNLKLERVKECQICGGGFYAHDLRRKTCDQQYGIDSNGTCSERSACEIIDQQKYNAEYYENTKVTLEKVHILVEG